MTRPLRLGPLVAEGLVVRRSGVHWLRPDGHHCRAGEIIAFCNLSLEPAGMRLLGAQPFAHERALQVAFAPRIGGTLRINAAESGGGFLTLLGVTDWNPGDVIAHIEPSEAGPVDGTAGTDAARLLLLAGRRMSWAVDVDDGLLPGWHIRARAWWGDTNDERPTLLSVGFCDATGVIRGETAGFVEMFEAATFPAQVVHVSEHPATPCAPFLLEQFLRTPADHAAIAADLTQALSSTATTSDDLIFGGALLAQLTHSPMRDTYDLLTSTGLRRQKHADAILLSLGAEARSILRHRTLGYSLQILAHDLRAAGPAMRAWLASSFEPAPRSFDDIRRDYTRLMDTVGAATGARFLILNRMSTSGREDIASYAAFDAPLGDTLANVAAKEMNLMLHELADERDLFIVDVDAAAADLGGAAHVPDGVHQSAAMQARLRTSVLEVLARL